MNDYQFKYYDYSLRSFDELRNTAPSFPGRPATEIEVSEWFTRRASDGKRATLRGFRGVPVTLTRLKLKSLKTLINAIDDVMQNPDEIYIFRGRHHYYYTYFRFYSDCAVMIDIKFNTDTPFIIDRVQVLKPEDVDTKRKGTLFYNG